MKLKATLCLALIMSLFLPVPKVSADNAELSRSLIDRPDDLAGYQIRLIYVVPADVQSRNLDINGAIVNWIEEIKKVSKVQIGLTPRFDTYLSKFDVGFLKSKFTLAQLMGNSSEKDAIKLLSKELPDSEQKSLKGIGFIIDGRIKFDKYCGYANTPGKYFTVWLGDDCEVNTQWNNSLFFHNYIAKVIMHEWLHNLGVEHTCVTDDLMWGEGCEAIERGDGINIDLNRVNYLGAEKSGVDISQLPVWEENINTGLINLKFQKTSKSSNPRRNSNGQDEIWGSFELSKDWADTESAVWSCQVKTSTGLIVNSLITSGLCKSKIPSNMKIGTRIYMTVSVEGLWQRSSDTQVFDVLGEKNEDKFCMTSICISGETIYLSIAYCYSTEVFGKLQIKISDDWKDLKFLKSTSETALCPKGFPNSIFTKVKGLPIGTHTLRWIKASDRSLSNYVSTYKEFEVVVIPEAK